MSIQGSYIQPASFTGVVADQQRRIRALEASPTNGHYEIKLVADVEDLYVQTKIFTIAIPLDLDTFVLMDAQIFVGTAGTGTTTVQLRKMMESSNYATAPNMLSTALTISSGLYTSWHSSPTRVISTAATGGVLDRQVFYRDIIAIDTTTVAVGSQGLGLILDFAAS